MRRIILSLLILQSTSISLLSQSIYNQFRDIFYEHLDTAAYNQKIADKLELQYLKNNKQYILYHNAYNKYPQKYIIKLEPDIPNYLLKGELSFLDNTTTSPYDIIYYHGSEPILFLTTDNSSINNISKHLELYLKRDYRPDKRCNNKVEKVLKTVLKEDDTLIGFSSFLGSVYFIVSYSGEYVITPSNGRLVSITSYIKEHLPRICANYLFWSGLTQKDNSRNTEIVNQYFNSLNQ